MSTYAHTARLVKIDSQTAVANTRLSSIETNGTATNTHLSTANTTATNNGTKLDTISSRLVDNAGVAAGVTLEACKTLLTNTHAQASDINVSTTQHRSENNAHHITLQGKVDSVNTNLSGTNSKLDDVAQKLGDIETAVQVLDNAIDGNEMQVDVVSMPTTTVTGTVTANLSAADNAVLDAIDNVLDASLVKQTAMATDLAALEVLQAATNSLISTLDGVQDSALLKLGEIETSADALIAANHTDLVALEASLASIEGKIDALDGVQDLALGKLGEIETSADALISANHTDLVALEASLTSMESKQDTQVTHLSNISSHTGTVDGCVASNKMNVNISSGNITGFATSALQTTLINDVGDLITDTADILTGVLDLEASLTSMEDKQDAQITHLSNIHTKNTNNETLLTGIDNVLDAIALSVHAEDAAHSSGDKGVLGLVVRQDSQSDLGADGDYVPMTVNANGELRVTSGASVSKTTVHRTVARDLATLGSHTDYQFDTGTEANFISFYINFIDTFDTSEDNLQVQYSQASNFANPIVVFQGSTQTVVEFNDDGSTYKRAKIELKNPARYVRLFNCNNLTALPVEGAIIIHGRE